MSSVFDRASKDILHASLAESGLFHRETEVSPDAQRIDVWYVPDAERPRASPDGHLLERMTRGPCTFEHFSRAPGEKEVVGCVRKQLNFLHILGKEEGASKVLPHQWLLSTGRPDKALQGMWAFAKPEWPRGVYDVAPLLRTSIVVISELPEEPATLIVRLMGRGKTFRRAVEELKALPAESFEHRKFRPILLEYRLEVVERKASPEEQEFIMATESLLEVWERKIATENQRIGQLTGDRGRVLKMLRLRFGELPPHVTRAVENADGDALDRFTERLFAATTPDDVIA